MTFSPYRVKYIQLRIGLIEGRYNEWVSEKGGRIVHWQVIDEQRKDQTNNCNLKFKEKKDKLFTFLSKLDLFGKKRESKSITTNGWMDGMQ